MIVLLTPTNSIGGAEAVAINLCSFLKANALDTELICCETGGGRTYEENYDKILLKQTATGSRIFRYLKIYRALKKHLALRANDDQLTLICFMSHMNILGCLLRRQVHTLILTEHNIEQPTASRLRGWIFAFLRQRLFRHADHVVGVSDGVTKMLKASNLKNAVTIPNHVPPPTMFHRPADSKSILVLGRLDVQKGFDIALKAFGVSGLYKNGYVLDIVGEGPEQQNLMQLATRLGVEASVKFHGARLDVSKFYLESRLMLFTSRWEGFGLTFIEAVLHCVPVVGTACHSGPDKFQEAFRMKGVTHPQESAEAIAKLLKAEIDAPTSLHDLMHYRESAVEWFGHAQTHEKYLSLIQE